MQSIAQDIERRRLTNAESRVFHYIRSVADKCGSCWASSARIANRLSLSETYVRRVRGRLVRWGFLLEAGWRGRFRCFVPAKDTPARTQSAITSGETNPPVKQAREAADPIRTESYRVPRASPVGRTTWEAVSRWSPTLQHYGFAKYLHSRLGRLIAGIDNIRRRHRGITCGDGNRIVREAIESAVRSGAGWGTIDAAMTYIEAVVMRCVRENRLPRGM